MFVSAGTCSASGFQSDERVVLTHALAQALGFAYRLPRSRACQKSIGRMNPQNPGSFILLVDDDESIRALLEICLSNAG